jgi:hypothetical protein
MDFISLWITVDLRTAEFICPLDPSPIWFYAISSGLFVSHPPAID